MVSLYISRFNQKVILIYLCNTFVVNCYYFISEATPELSRYIKKSFPKASRKIVFNIVRHANAFANAKRGWACFSCPSRLFFLQHQAFQTFLSPEDVNNIRTCWVLKKNKVPLKGGQADVVYLYSFICFLLFQSLRVLLLFFCNQSWGSRYQVILCLQEKLEKVIAQIRVGNIPLGYSEYDHSHNVTTFRWDNIKPLNSLSVVS